MKSRRANGQHAAAGGQPAADESAVEVARVYRLPERPAVRSGPQRKRSAVAILRNDAERRKRGVALPIVEEQPRPDDAPIEVRQIGPSVAIEIAPRLTVVAAEQRPRPCARGRLRVVRRHIASVLGRRVDEQPRLGLARATRDEIDDAAERRRPVQSRRDAFDDFHLTQVERRHLQQAERIALRAVQRQPVGKQLRVAAPQSLDSYVRRAERRRRRLHAQAGRLVEQHRHAAGRHHRLLVDLLLVDDFDAQRLILQPGRRSRGGYGDRLFDRRWLFELDRHGLLSASGDGDRRRHRSESCLEDRDFNRSRTDVDPNLPASIGHVGLPGDNNLRARRGRSARRDRATRWPIDQFERIPTTGVLEEAHTHSSAYAGLEPGARMPRREHRAPSSWPRDATSGTRRIPR